MASPVDLRPDTERADPAPLDSLLRAAAGGNRIAFAALYDWLSPAVYAVVRARATDLAAEAMVIEVFLELWRVVPQFPEQGSPAAVWARRVIFASIQRERLDQGLVTSAERRLPRLTQNS